MVRVLTTGSTEVLLALRATYPVLGHVVCGILAHLLALLVSGVQIDLSGDEFDNG